MKVGYIMNVLSLFDGISCGQIALERAGFKVANYYASEIDTNAIAVTMENYPNTIQLGDIKNWREWDIKQPDLIMGGSPCQGFSRSGKGLNFEDPRSKLFFDFVDVVKTLKPKYFLLENVSMKKEWQDVISDYLGVQPISINSKIMSAQSRPRLYWTNIPDYKPPGDKKVMLSSILEVGDVDTIYNLPSDYFVGTGVSRLSTKNDSKIKWKVPEATLKGFITVEPGECVDLTFVNSKTRRGRSMKEKSNCLTASPQMYCKATSNWFRRFTPLECERLQTVPDNYTSILSDNHRYKALGNGWTVDVVAHIFKNIP